MRLNLARGCFHLISPPIAGYCPGMHGAGLGYCLLLLGLVSKLLPEPFPVFYKQLPNNLFWGIGKLRCNFIALAKVQKDFCKSKEV